MEDREGKDLQAGKSAGLIDVSTENDSLVMAADTDFNLDGHKISGTSHADKALEMGQACEQREKLPQLLATSEPERATKTAKCNLRKSLAWDSAFFTSAGVLDAEELSTMIEGGEKGVKHFLPGIQEDVHTSMDSISTLESDNLTLESLEAELFEDIRASIQKSSRASKMATLSSNAAPEGKTPQPKASSTSKKVDIATGNKPMPKSGMKTTNSAMTGSGKMIKQSKNSPQVTQPVTRIRESTTSIPRPAKSISNVNPMPSVATKRASLSANHFKVENNNANSTTVILKGTQASKSTSLIGPRRGLPKSSSSSRTSSLASSTASKTESMRPSSSCGSSGSSSDNVGKSTTTSARRNLSKVNSSGPIPKTPSRAALRCKISAPTAGLSAHVISSKLSSSISPASSISEWSVESSSSTSTVNQTSTSRTSIDASSSCRSSNGDLDFNIHVADKTSDRNRNQRTELSSQNLKKAATQTSSLSRPESIKPSGLRMPSPKIGFFDGSKSVRTPNGGVPSQARLSTGLPKLGSGLSPIGNSSKAKLGKLPPTKVVKASTNLKPDSQCSASLTVSKELPSQSAKGTIIYNDAKIIPRKSPDVQPEVGESSCLQIEHETESGKLEIANNEINMQEIVGLKEIFIPIPKGEMTDSTLDTCGAEIKLHEGVEDAIYGLDYPKNKSPGETNEKAADNFGDQIDDLAKDFVGMDLQLAMQNEVAGNTSSCCELRCSNPCARELCSKQNYIDVLKEESTTDYKEIVISPPEVGESSCLQIEHERESGKREIANNEINMQEIAGSKEIVIPFYKGEITGATPDIFGAEIKPHGGVEDAIHELDCLKNKSPGETNEEATDHFGDQIDDFVAMDLQPTMQNEVAGNTSFCCELRCSDPCARELCSKHNLIDVLKEECTTDLKEIVISSPEGDITGSSLDTCVGITIPSGVDEDAIHGQDDHKDKLSGKMKETETDLFEDQIDDFAARDFFANDLQIALMKAIADSTESYCELSCSKSCAPDLGCEQNFIDVQKEKPTADFKEIVIPLQEGGGIIDSSLDTCDGEIKPHGPGEDAIHEDDLENKALGETNEKETDPLGDIKPHGVDEDAIHGQDDHKDELSGEMKEMETDPFEDLIDNLAARDFFAKDLLIALEKAIADSTESCCELSCSNPCAPELGCEQNFIDVQKEKPTDNFKEIGIPLQEGGGIIDSSLDTRDDEIKPHGPGEDAMHEDALENKALGETNEEETDPLGDIKPPGVDEDAIHGQDDHKDELSGEMKEMETDPFEDQIDDLAARDFFAKDLLIALGKAIADSIESCCELSCSNPCAPELGCGQNFIDVQKENPTANFKEIVSPLQEGGGIIDSSLDTCDGKINPHGPGEDTFHEDDPKNKARGETNEEETNSFGDQVDDLARNFVAMDLQFVTQKEIAGSTKPCCDLSCSNSFPPELCSTPNFTDTQKEETLASTCENSNPDPPELHSERNFIEVQERPTDESGGLSRLNPCAIELSSEKKFLEVQKEEPAANSRTPLIEKNSLYSSEGFDIVTGSGIEAVEKTTDLPSSEIIQKENS